MIKLGSSDLGQIPPALTKDNLKVKQPPGLSQSDIIKSLNLKKLGPRQGKSFVGKGGLKPYRKPADGTKIVSTNIRFRKPLRAPKQRNV